MLNRPSSRPLWPSPHQKIQNLLDDQKYVRHRHRIKTAAPVVDTTSPPTYHHLRVKLKKIQIESERQAKILQENMLLLKRMSDILHSRGPFGYQRPIQPSGHGEQRRRYGTGQDVERLYECVPNWNNAGVEVISELSESAKLKRVAENSKLCPRYIRLFYDQREGSLLHTMVGPRRASSSVTPTPSSQKNSCEACREQSKRANKSADVVRPKAAAPRRRTQPLIPQSVESEQGDQARDEQCASVNLSEQFRKDFQLD